MLNRRIIILFTFALPAMSGFASCSGEDKDYEQLKKDPVKTRAVIIDKKNYLPNSPVSHEFFYSYRFTVDGRTFEGNSGVSNLKVGDSIEVTYSRSNPDISEPED